MILNGLTNPSNIITFNGVPTVLKIDSSGDGDKAKLEITVSTGGNIGEKCYITVNGYTITSTNVVGNDVSSVYLSPLSLGNTYTKASALSIVRAFQNTGLINNYNIYADKNSSKVIIEAKEIGSQYNFTETDSNATYISFSTPTNGSSSDLLTGSKVTLDVYTEGKHLVSLDKNYYKNGLNFDLSPVLAIATKNGKVTEYNVTASYTKNGQTNFIGELSNNYAVNGYSVNQGKFYIPKFTGTYLAQNVSRGRDKGYYNNTTLYYLNGKEITLSFYCSDFNQRSIVVEYYDSAMNHLVSSVESVIPTSKIHTFKVTPTNEDAYYIIIRLPNGDQIRYTNVKPLKYGNENDYQTLYWYNSYGGVSFFPFTGKREESRETEKVLYKKQNFNIYTDTIKSMNKVYSMNNEYKVTLTTHLMDKDGIYSLYDLMNSYEVWTEVNATKYEVIIDQVEVTETNVSGVWQGKVTYKYSSPDRY